MSDAEWQVSEPCAPVMGQATKHAEWQVGEPCSLSPTSFRAPTSVMYRTSAPHVDSYSRNQTYIEAMRQPEHAWVQSKPRSSTHKAPSSISGSVTEDSSSVASSKMSISSSQQSAKQTPSLPKSSVYRYKEIYGNIPEHPAKRPGYEPPPLAEMPKLKADQIKQSVQRLNSAVPKHRKKPSPEPVPKPKPRPASASRANMVPRVATLHQTPKEKNGAAATCFHAPDFHNCSHSSLASARTASVAQRDSALTPTTQRAPSEDRTVHELFQEFDTMRTGRLGIRDLREALLRLRLKTNFEEARQILFTYDKDGDGKLNFAEFAVMFKALTTFLAKKGLAAE